MPNIAAIDVGSNAIRMVVGRLNIDGKIETLESLRLPVRLGQDAFSRGVFSEQTMQMAVDAFLRFKNIREVFDVEQVRTVATSAMRETSNSEALIDMIARETGFQVELISGDEEARLIHLAVINKVDLKQKRCVMIDIGGGSVEVTLSDGERVLSTESYGMGTVRLLKKLESNDGQNISFNHLLREYAESARKHIDREIGNEKIEICLGTGGNIEEIGRLRRRLFKKEREDLISLDELERLIEKLDELSVEERIRKMDLRPDRADVILPAAVVLHMIVKETGVKEILIPCVGLKDGVLLDMLPVESGPQVPRRDQALESADRMGRKYAYDSDHAYYTRRMARQIFEMTAKLHMLSENELLLLEIAAMLHDIGHFINTLEHDQHGYYLLCHHVLIGLTSNEQKIAANIVRYHRKENPAATDENIRSLSTRDRLIVIKLCSILRIADALDTSHTARINDILIEKNESGRWELSLRGDGEFMLEKWTLEKRKVLFQETFGISLVVV
ncbi:MAG: Ppx/GppA phosphatase family protein [Chloroflexota bacterium]